jgi:hypothetical protein
VSKAIIIGCFCFFCFAKDIVFLTANADPTKTIILQALSKSSAPKMVKINGMQATLLPKPIDKSNYYLFTYFFHDLQSNTQYHFTIDDKEYQFKTVDPLSFRFAVAGDSELNKTAEKLLTIAAGQKIDLFFMCGDISYSQIWFFFYLPHRLIKWIKMYKKATLSHSKNLIPIIAAIGNHDVKGGYGQQKAKARLFYDLFFPQNDRSYFDFTIGSAYFLILDSGHTESISGRQYDWLFQKLNHNKRFPTFVFQHVGCYPSTRIFHWRSKKIRSVWAPLFEMGNVNGVFEHHDHAIKRTYPLQNQQAHPKGVVYFGDGALGVPTKRKSKKRWYFAKTAQSNGFWLVEVKDKEFIAQAIDAHKKVIDRVIFKKIKKISLN